MRGEKMLLLSQPKPLASKLFILNFLLPFKFNFATNQSLRVYFICVTAEHYLNAFHLLLLICLGYPFCKFSRALLDLLVDVRLAQWVFYTCI